MKLLYRGTEPSQSSGFGNLERARPVLAHFTVPPF